MDRNQLRTWRKLGFSLAWASLFSLLTYLVLATLPAAAINEFPYQSNKDVPRAPLADGSIFTITGIVRDQAETPVAGVQVFAFSGVVSAETFTNNNGQYTLTLLTGNYYDIVFNPPMGSGLGAEFERGVHQEGTLDKKLLPGYSISGTVYRDESWSQAQENVSIFVFNQETYQGFGMPPTTASGTYKISLAAGHWGLTFTPPPFLGLGPTHTAVILIEDITRDIILQPGFTLYGQVKKDNSNGQPNVEIFAKDPAQSSGYGFTPTGPTGLYTGTLPTGTFDIQFLPPPFLGFGATVVTDIIGPPDKALTLTLPTGYTVSGTVRCSNGLANAFVHAAPHPPIPGDDIGGWGHFAGSDGFYSLALQPGAYTFTVSSPEGIALPQRVVPGVVVTQNLTLNFDYHCFFLPILFKK
jgi:hypothetical protein